MFTSVNSASCIVSIATNVTIREYAQSQLSHHQVTLFALSFRDSVYTVYHFAKSENLFRELVMFLAHIDPGFKLSELIKKLKFEIHLIFPLQHLHSLWEMF
jgi:hypothetical protein